MRLRPQEYQSDPNLSQQVMKITSLAIQQTFNYFQIQLLAAPNPERSEPLKKFIIQLFSNNGAAFKDLTKLIEDFPKPLSDVTAIIYLTFR